jgi:hypothetical protein
MNAQDPHEIVFQVARISQGLQHDAVNLSRPMLSLYEGEGRRLRMCNAVLTG